MPLHAASELAKNFFELLFDKWRELRRLQAEKERLTRIVAEAETMRADAGEKMEEANKKMQAAGDKERKIGQKEHASQKDRESLEARQGAAELAQQFLDGERRPAWLVEALAGQLATLREMSAISEENRSILKSDKPLAGTKHLATSSNLDSTKGKLDRVKKDSAETLELLKSEEPAASTKHFATSSGLESMNGKLD
ncbi:hypothetical protein TI39_contig4288g00002 [Zymoseptoria brevis]|uniref:Uncharacterized protein n=1 Tax=Zymoseptoria brevis TaxID=1047168 RepID=A0A0F4G878_9PEZI|nr:hypothetical protein TI39_contig4288g00002 [Zymoseptoria brevis]